MGTCAADSSIVKNWTEHAPSSYSLRINNLSQLTLDKYESRRFLSGGHTWRLVIYPKGNVTDNGIGFISMYVEKDDTSLPSTPPAELFAYLIFFVYNKKENKYFTIQDGQARRFNALSTVCGLSQVLSLETFNDPEKGYIFNGEQCEFGADVIVTSPFTKWEIVSFNREIACPNFSWSVVDFTVLKENYYLSDSFSVGGRKWALKLYPKGDLRVRGKWLSIYLQLDDSETLMADEKIFVRARLQFLDQRGSFYVRKICNWYTESNKSWGVSRFLSLAEIPKAFFQLDENLDIEVEFEVVSATKYSPTI